MTTDTQVNTNPVDFAQMFGRQDLRVSAQGDLTKTSNPNLVPAARQIALERFAVIEGEQIMLPGVSTPLGDLEYSVRTGPTPVFRAYDDFRHGLDPVLWGHYLTGMTTEPSGEPTRTPTGWCGQLLEIVRFDLFGDAADSAIELEIENILDVEFTVEDDRTVARYSLVNNENGILLKNQGEIIAAPSLSGRMGTIFATKTIQLSPTTPYRYLGPFIPAILDTLLALWIWEYAVKLSLLGVPTLPPPQAGLWIDQCVPEPQPWSLRELDWEFERDFRSRFGYAPTVLDLAGRYSR